MAGYYNGKLVVGLAVFQLPDANALETSWAIQAKMGHRILPELRMCRGRLGAIGIVFVDRFPGRETGALILGIAPAGEVGRRRDPDL